MPDYAKTLQEELLLDGRLFTEEINDDATSLDYLLQNPSGSGVDIVAITSRLTHVNDITVTIYDEVSGISGGTAQDAENNFIGYPRTEEANPIRDPSFSGDNVHSSTAFLGSDTEFLLEGNKMAIQPGEEVLFSLQDDTGSAKTMALLLTWGEIPEGTYR